VVPDDRKEIFRERGEVDFAYSVANVGRFRANVFKQRGSISMVLRKLRFGGPSFEEIGLPDAVRTARSARALLPDPERVHHQ
jgi:twitching motility protein PilT